MSDEIRLDRKVFLELTPDEVSTVLDSLAVRPYNVVARVIQNIIQQVQSANPTEVPQGDVDKG